MKAMIFILFVTFFISVSCFSTYSISKISKSKLLKYLPISICLLGILCFGIVPQIFHYAQGITINLIFTYLVISCVFAFTASLLTLIYVHIKKDNPEKC